MRVEAKIVAVLSDSEAITTICGDHITAGAVPESWTAPWVNVWVVSDNPAMWQLSRRSCRLQINCVGQTINECNRLIDAVRATLDGYTCSNVDIAINQMAYADFSCEYESSQGVYLGRLDFLTNFKNR